MPYLLTSWLYYAVAVWAGRGRAEGVLAKYFANKLSAASGSLEAVLAELKAIGQPLEAARGLMQVVELSNDN